jgi:hypothetical protein
MKTDENTLHYQTVNSNSKVHIMEANATYGYRKVLWAPIKFGDLLGIMEIQEYRKIECKAYISRYLVRWRLPTDTGHHYHLTKAGGESTYDVEIGPRPICHCTGYLQWSRCKHIEGLKLLQDAGYLDIPLDYQI